jgi:hypothetical protein
MELDLPFAAIFWNLALPYFARPALAAAPGGTPDATKAANRPPLPSRGFAMREFCPALTKVKLEAALSGCGCAAPA